MEETLDSVLERCLDVCEARSPHDAVAVALHACLLADGFVCIACGDENFGEGAVATHSPTSSKAGVHQSSPYGLPRGWNTSPDVYALQYQHSGRRKLVLVKLLVMDSQLIISAMSSDAMEVIHSVTLDTERYVRAQSFNTVSVYSNLLQLVSTLNKEIVGKLSQEATAAQQPPQPPPGASSTTVSGGSTTSSTSSSRGQNRGDYDPLRVGPPRHPGGLSSIDPLRMPTPFGYGDSDRFPFGGIGGGGGGAGMIFDPMRGGGGRMGGGGGFGGGLGPAGPFPPGHIPGARWDPVTPFGGGGVMPGRGGRGRGGRHHGEPDPDHLPPPGSDDMFS